MSDDTKINETMELRLNYDERGLIPVVVQDAEDSSLLMLAYANRRALEITKETGYATFWSRSKKRLWTKGRTSGDLLEMVDIRVDCDQDSLLYRVKKVGENVCHTKRKSCFYRRINTDGGLEFIK